jgi:GNAT superfamily N-acetyltransferase
MDIRQATLADVEEILNYLISFAAASPYTNLVDFYRVGQLAGKFILDDDKLALICPGKGMILATTLPFLWGTKRTATEMAWWVEPKYRKQGIGGMLIEAFEDWAKEKGCVAITLTSLDDTKVEKLYDKLGYKLCEQTYIKEI